MPLLGKYHALFNLVVGELNFLRSSRQSVCLKFYIASKRISYIQRIQKSHHRVRQKLVNKITMSARTTGIYGLIQSFASSKEVK